MYENILSINVKTVLKNVEQNFQNFLGQKKTINIDEEHFLFLTSKTFSDVAI